MNTFRQILLVASRDFLQRAKSRAFLVSMVVIIGLVAAVGPLMTMEMRDAPAYEIGLVGTRPGGLETALSESAGAFDKTVDLTSYLNTGEGEAAIADDRADVLIVDGIELVWNERPSLELASIITAAVQGIDRRQVIADLGLSTGEAASLLSPPPLDSRTLNEPDPEAGPKQVAAYAGSFILYISILMFGQFVMMGVMEEKSSRVVEVVLSRVRPHELLAGKVMGIGVLGLVQLILLGGASLLMVSMFDIADVDLGALSMRVLLWIVFWYLLGFAFFSVVYAAIGATVSRQEDAQSVGMLPVMLLLPGYFVSLAALENPDGTLATIGSMVPPLSPLVMPIRASLTDVPSWEMLISIALVVAATYLLIRLGGRVYRGSILRIGAKVPLREAWRSAGQ
ncbi:MAG: ABC transporter permease [Acidimicrobiia bacterium]|nr:ABC transporter permease [Acidimicrobiia bacterium]